MITQIDERESHMYKKLTILQQDNRSTHKTNTITTNTQTQQTLKTQQRHKKLHRQKNTHEKTHKITKKTQEGKHTFTSIQKHNNKKHKGTELGHNKHTQNTQTHNNKTHAY